MNCSKCNAEWTPPKNVVIIKCPFCSEPIFEVKASGKPKEPYEVLVEIVEQFGRSTLGQPRLRGLLADLMPSADRKHQRIFRQAVDDKIGEKLLDMQSDTHAVRNLKIAALKENFKNNNAFNHNADYVVDCFLFSLGWFEGTPMEKQNHVSVDGMNILNQQVELAFYDRKLTKDEALLLFRLAESLHIPETTVSELLVKKIKSLNLSPVTTIDKLIKNHKTIICTTDWQQKPKSTTSETRVRWKTISYKADENDEQYGLIVGHDYTVWIAQNDGVTKEGKTVKKGERFAIKNDTVTKSTTLEEKSKSGITYESVKIGNQVWMKRNLDVSHFRNGDVIPEVKTNKEWERAGEKGKPAWCYYDNDPENGITYGKLYNWYAVNDPRGLAPEDWRVPSYNDWIVLESFLGRDRAGIKMKSTSGWREGYNGNDQIRFNGVPAGYRRTDGTFDNLGSYGHFWSSSEGNAWVQFLNFSIAPVGRNSGVKCYGFSVRCLRRKTLDDIPSLV